MDHSRLGAMSRLDKRGGLEFDRQGFFSTSVCSFDEYNHYKKREHGNSMNDHQTALLHGLLQDTELQFEQFTRQQGYKVSEDDKRSISRPIETIPEDMIPTPKTSSGRKRSRSHTRSQTMPSEVDFAQRNLQDNLSKSYNISSQGNVRPQRKRTPKQYAVPSDDLAHAFQQHPNLNILDGAPGSAAPREMLVQKQTLYKHPADKENLAFAEGLGNVGNMRPNRSKNPESQSKKLGSRSAIDWGIDKEIERRAQEVAERPLHVGKDIIYINNKPFQVLARDPGGSLDSRHVTMDKPQSSPKTNSNNGNNQAENVSNNNRHSLSGNNGLRSASLGNFQGEIIVGRQGKRRRHKNTRYHPAFDMQGPLCEQDGNGSLNAVATAPTATSSAAESDYGPLSASSHPNTSPVSDIDYADVREHVVTSKQHQTRSPMTHAREAGSVNDRAADKAHVRTHSLSGSYADNDDLSMYIGNSHNTDPHQWNHLNYSLSSNAEQRQYKSPYKDKQKKDFKVTHATNQTQKPNYREQSVSDEKSGKSETIAFGHGNGSVKDTTATTPCYQAPSEVIIDSGAQQAVAGEGRREEQPQHSGALQQYRMRHTPLDSDHHKPPVYFDDYNDDICAPQFELITHGDKTSSMIAVQRTSPNSHAINDGLGTKQDRPKSSKLRTRRPPPVEDNFTTAVSNETHEELKIDLGELGSSDLGKGRRAQRYIPEPEPQGHAPQPQILKRREQVGSGVTRPQSAWRRGFKSHDDDENESSSDDSDVDGEIEILDLDVIEPFSDDEGGKPVVLVHDETASTASSDRVMTPRLTEREMCDLRLEKMHSIKKCRRRFLSDSSITNENDDNPLPETSDTYSPLTRESSSVASSEQNAGITPELVYQHYGNRVVDNYRRRAASDVSILADTTKVSPRKIVPKEKPAKLKPLIPGSGNNSSDGDSARDNRLLPPLSKRNSKKKHKKAETTNVVVSKPPVPGKSRTKLNPLPHDGNTLSVNLSDVDADDDELENESRRLEREIAKLRSLALNQTPRTPSAPRDDMDSEKFFGSERDKTIVGHAEESKRSNLAKSRADLANGSDPLSFHYTKGDHSGTPPKRPLGVSRSMPMDGQRLHNRKKSLSDIMNDLKEGSSK